MDIKHEVATAPIPTPVAHPISENINEENKVENNEGQQATHKGKKSYIWTHFKQLLFSETNGEHKAKCKNGTLHGYMPKVGEEGEANKTCTKVNGYSLEDCRKAMAEFIILDEHLFKVVVGIGFRKMINRFEPRFTVPFRMTIYMSLTVHFVDDEWKLQKRILNFCLIENHKGKTIGREIETCLREWKIEKVFTITLDNASSNDGVITYFQRKLAARGGLVCGEKYLQMRCCAHVLNLIVNDGIKEQHASIESIRNAVRWFGEDCGGKKKVGSPTALDWQHARLFIDFLRIFYEITLCFSSSLHVTSNKCFHEIASIHSQLTS
ncbi:zinc finger BED domain-containing protein RICESLEEPER 2-like [Arachis duranensis]|uniref:Zinc finger BED domain-containing protein RICESLEEPER 2-like n=1 Tax=Arachis duranensis TaxID=130453 RepID=A0A6P4DBA7_ARADU|nr:zinc finger BED domain-containing protein RICESLEEPER 2-like [Arachis duranensis]